MHNKYTKRILSIYKLNFMLIYFAVKRKKKLQLYHKSRMK